MSFQAAPIEQYPEISSLDGIAHGFLLRQPDVEVNTDREATLVRLEAGFAVGVTACGLEPANLATAEQVHGAGVAVVGAAGFSEGVDGLISNTVGVALGIVVADCGAVYLVDPVNRAVGLVHSGKKGTEGEISAVAIRQMRDEFGSDPAEMIVRLSPCIRPPAYEVDIAGAIREQVLAEGVPAESFYDDGVCTTSDLGCYYSYRAEKGATGRMLAMLGLI